MKKLTLLVFMLLTFNIVNAIPIADADKKEHFILGNIEADVLRSYKLNYWQRILAVVATATLKEHVDVNCGGKWDNGDILASTLGAAIKLDYEIKF